MYQSKFSSCLFVSNIFLQSNKGNFTLKCVVLVLRHSKRQSSLLEEDNLFYQGLLVRSLVLLVKCFFFSFRRYWLKTYIYVYGYLIERLELFFVSITTYPQSTSEKRLTFVYAINTKKSPILQVYNVEIHLTPKPDN